METNYSVYGTFEVTTEGDCEGRSTRHLGTHTGYIDEIALALADKCYYKLYFKRVELLDMSPKRKSVNISIDDCNNKFFHTVTEKENYFKNIFADRPVNVSCLSSSYGSVTLSTDDYDPDYVKKQQALAKLTNEEKELLGLD